MKKLAVLLALGFAISTAAVKANTIDSVAGINVASDPGTTISSVSGPGVLTGLSCKVTTAVTGAFWGIFINVDGGGYTAVQGGAYVSTSTWQPANFISVGNGSAVGDVFYIPLHVPFTTSLSVISGSFFAGSGGVLTCSAYH